MIFRKKDTEEWVRKYAWLPVEVNDYTIWLERYDKRCFIEHGARQQK